MFSIWTVSAITLVYLVFLFAIARWGNRQQKLSKNVYSLSLGVHCTSWAFFGTATQASEFGWPLVPTYLGCILVMFFGVNFYKKVALLCQQHQISSLSEFIGIRFHHSNSIAGIIVAICIIGVIPYIALQLDAISMAVALLTDTGETGRFSISFYITVTMALFAVLYGHRTLDLTQKHQGLMYTLAFESIVKLVGLAIVGIFVVYVLHDGVFDLFSQALKTPSINESLTQPFAFLVFASHVLLGICAMFCLPRQFHVNFIENRNTEEIDRARWLFPIYLSLMSIFVLPIAVAGDLAFLGQSGINADRYVLLLPQKYDAPIISIVGFLGGLAASTSMVIVATLALSNMVNTSLIMPIWLKTRRLHKAQPNLSSKQLLRTRQFSIAALVFIAYLYHVQISQTAPLVKSGTIALALLSQIFPAILFSVYWDRVNKVGIMLGLGLGVTIVIVNMVYPAVVASYYFAPQPTDEAFAYAIFLSLAVNIFVIALTSVIFPNTKLHPFMRQKLVTTGLQITPEALLNLVEPVLTGQAKDEFRQKVERQSKLSFVDPITILHAQRLLSARLGAASAQILLNAVADNKNTDHTEITELVEQASQTFQFRHEVLQSSIANLPQGISVVDAELRLVAWNKAYENLFQYPNDFLSTGMPIKDSLMFNVSQITTDATTLPDAEAMINQRIDYIQGREPYKVKRQLKSGKVYEVSGSPLPGGGYITTYTDITEYMNIQKALEDSKTELEDRVQQRTHELQLAKKEAEEANESKTKFLAATGHDLMQPISAATLFASLLNEKLLDEQLKETSHNLLNSLENADQQLSMLIEFSKLDSGRVVPSETVFPLNQILKNVVNDFRLMAQNKGIQLHFVETSLLIRTDKRLFTRIVQNLMSNAVRYTTTGKVLIGVRRRKNNRCELCVIDTGPGIDETNQRQIFQEFARLNQTSHIQGLGLGLTIVERMCRLLNIKIGLKSNVLKGSLFSLDFQHLGRVTEQKFSTKLPTSDRTTQLKDCYIMVLENDESVITALTALLTEWGCNISVARQKREIQVIPENIDFIIADYHLDNDENGVDLIEHIRYCANKPIKAILSSADRSDSIRDLASTHNLAYLPKPIKGPALKRLLLNLLAR
ncbi:hybrid sensor histidine kinase/response regulator [Glaciecola sp. 1036]|uniref:hybrid sensor histidine kinase/response regulator n=1 Tax=Alteromonadaceae TaxID=72275 RepID=UPI003CFEF478